MSAPQDYNDIAAQFGEYIGEAVTEWTLGFPSVVAMLEPVDGKRILDYGCGAGNFSCFLDRKGAHVTGIDVSKTMIEIARSKTGSAKFLWRPSAAGGVPKELSAAFDAATLNFVLCTMSEASDIVAVLRDVHEFLKPGGVCLTLHTNWERCNGKEFASFRLDKVEVLQSGAPIGLMLKSNPPVRINDYFWSQAQYCTYYRAAGFAEVSAQEITASNQTHPSWIDESTTSPFYVISGRNQEER